MLGELDAVPWAKLECCGGPATDVPVFLRRLLSPRETTRARAASALIDALIYQGNFYEATLPAIPFLAEVAQSPNAKGRADAAFILALIGNGDGYLEGTRSPPSEIQG